MRRLWILGLLLTFVACREKAPPEGAVRVTVGYGSYRPACLRVVARDTQGHEGQTEILQRQFKDPDARKILVAVFREPEWGRELTLEVSSFDGSTGEACSGSLVEQLSSQPIPVPLGDFAAFEATLRAKDDDGDSFIAREAGVNGLDCDDTSAEVYPGAAERCSVAVDYDCNGFKGCQDSQCQQKACDDGNACTTDDFCEGSGVSAQCKGQEVRCEKPAGACVLGATCSQETGQCVVTRKECNTPESTCFESVGACNDATGFCEYTPKAASVSCDDSDACTTGDVCSGTGVCLGTQTPCMASSICFRVTGGCTALGNCTEEPDPSKVNAACTLAGGAGSGVCRASDGRCSRFPYVPSNFDPDAIPTESILPLTTTCEVTFDSTALSWTPESCVSNPPAPIELTQGHGMVLFALSNLNLGGNLRLVGNRPVILAVYGDATLNQNILANARGTLPGAGGGLESACTERRGRGGVYSNLVGGGGGGAGGGTAGAPGGNGTSSGSERGDGGSTGGDSFVPLVGGCSGGSGGGGGGAEALGGQGGAGGGAVQLSVAGTLTVNQRVSASAGGGSGGQYSNANGGQAGGGGGGGSGGQVLLEAYQLNLGSSGRLTANGGGGGEGSGYHSSLQRNGKVGADGSVDSGSQVAGGSGDSQAGGEGGNGGALSGTPGAGTAGTDVGVSAKGGGGGGGGAAGHIRLRSVRPCAINSSSIISPATDTQCPL
ncbi:putative metal-binding motif-containing protein [Archangium violaceum]|uniref:putative metal-binding motif-containing protein n=1 Tax=Archangium violaceum TaxID=83451 RepID=UPI00193BAE7D|nr:putative metal-binding motif-containing protein [Archangium violaceum]QRK04309.1 putative metal-binding motif-containing protein [Archangium violaceum]